MLKSLISALYEGIKELFPNGSLFFDPYTQSSNPTAFPVLMSDGRIEDATTCSTVLSSLPFTNVTYIFADPSIASDVESYIAQNREQLLGGTTQ
jgi:hypothetical protein